MVNFHEYMESIFGEIAHAAGMGSHLSNLKTKDLEDDRKKTQFPKLKCLKPHDSNAIELPSASFLCRFKADDVTYLCVQTEDLSEAEIRELNTTLAYYDTLPEELDESIFMFLAHEFQNVYRIKADQLRKDNATNVLALVEEQDYQGHDIFDVMNWFENITIFSIAKDSKLENCSKWFLAAYLSTSCTAFRAKSFPAILAIKLNELLKHDNINPENIYYASSSLHLRQCFMEIYRCLEAIFYLPWIKKLKANPEFKQDGLALSHTLKDAIGWRQKEKESIEELFSLVSDHIVKDEKVKLAKVFDDFDFPTTEAKVFGRRIYKIRNILVHQQDHEDISPLEIFPNCWPSLVEYILDITLDLYSNHKSDCNFIYSSEL